MVDGRRRRRGLTAASRAPFLAGIGRLDHVNELSTLTRLELSYNALASLELSGLLGLRLLESVDVSHNRVAVVKGVREGSGGALVPPIRSLDLSYNPITDLESVAGLGTFVFRLALLWCHALTPKSEAQH